MIVKTPVEQGCYDGSTIMDAEGHLIATTEHIEMAEAITEMLNAHTQLLAVARAADAAIDTKRWPSSNVWSTDMLSLVEALKVAKQNPQLKADLEKV